MMPPYEKNSDAMQFNGDLQGWFTKPGPTESFLRSAPKHLLQDNRETAPAIRTDPRHFTTVGPTSSFVLSR